MKPRRVIIGIGVVLLCLYLFTGVTQIRPGERAVVRRFGKVVDTPGPGLRIGLPWGIDRVDRIPVDMVRRIRVGYVASMEESQGSIPGQLLTGDHNLVNLQAVLDYAVQDDQIENYLIQSSQADALVERAAESALAEWVACRTVDDVLLTGKAQLPLWLAHETQQRIDPYRLGIRIQAASITQLSPPDEVKDAFEKVTRAQTAVRTRELEARQVAEKMLRGAEAQRYQTARQTDAYVNNQVRMAQTEAAAFSKRREQYHRLRKENPDILAGIWWDEMSKLFVKMKNNGRIDLLDKYLAGDGLDITLLAPQMDKK